jgi:hypothetical protein
MVPWPYLVFQALFGVMWRIIVWLLFTFAVVNTIHIGTTWNGEVNANEWLRLVLTGTSYAVWFSNIKRGVN